MSKHYLTADEQYQAYVYRQNGVEVWEIVKKLDISPGVLYRLYSEIAHILAGGNMIRAKGRTQLRECINKIKANGIKLPTVADITPTQTNQEPLPWEAENKNNDMSITDPYKALEHAEQLRIAAIEAIVKLEVEKRVRHITEVAKQSNLVGTLQKHFAERTQ